MPVSPTVRPTTIRAVGPVRLFKSTCSGAFHGMFPPVPAIPTETETSTASVASTAARAQRRRTWNGGNPHRKRVERGSGKANWLCIVLLPALAPTYARR